MTKNEIFGNWWVEHVLNVVNDIDDEPIEDETDEENILDGDDV